MSSNPPAFPKPQIRRRLALIVILCAIGGALFAPFALAGAGTHSAKLAAEFWIALPIGSAIFGGLCAWAGLRLADRTKLPMPLLRRWENGARLDGGRKWYLVSILTAVAFALATETLASMVGLPKNPGTLWERLATIPFAAIVTETFAHLFLMSLIFFWLRSKWAAILLSSAAFTAVFHGGGIAGSIELTIVALAFNFLFATLTGWLYGRYGIESAYLAHAVAHGIVLGIN